MNKVDLNEMFYEKQGLIFAAIRQEFGSYDRAGEIARINYMDLDDLIQIGRLTLWKLLLKYEESRRESFTGYVVESIRWRFKTELHTKGLPMKTPINCTPEKRKSFVFESIHHVVMAKDNNISQESVFATPENIEETIINRMTIKEKLTDQEYLIFKWRDDGYSDVEISKFIGITFQSVNRIRNRAVKRINPNYIPSGKKVRLLTSERDKQKAARREGRTAI